MRTRNFVRSAATADGVVIENVWSRSTNSSSGTYHPRVRFRTPRGQEIDFVSDTGSTPASFRVHDNVQVFYDPENPTKASINSFGSLWMLPLIFSGLGSVFFAIGVVPFAWTRRVRRRDDWLRSNGRHIQADFERVELNTSLRVNGASPYRIVCQWLDPATNRVHVFRSHNLWYDPHKYITAKTLDVIVDPNNLKRYVVDTQFLPKMVD
jgi:hypothetical protein